MLPLELGQSSGEAQRAREGAGRRRGRQRTSYRGAQGDGAEGAEEKRPNAIKASVGHSASVGARRRELTEGMTEGEKAPAERRRRGEAVGQAHERDGDERRRGRSYKTPWTRPMPAERAHCMPKLVITACTGAHNATLPAKQCLGVCPSWGGLNYGGNLVKKALVKYK